MKREHNDITLSDKHKWSSLSDPHLLMRMTQFVDPRPKAAVLDVGCGPDANSAIAYAQKGCEVTAIDADEATINRASKIANMKGIKINFKIYHFNNALPFDDGSFDVVTCRAALHHFPDKDAFFKEASRVLKANGRLNIMDPVVSEELHPIWTILSRMGEADHYSYATFMELMKLHSNNCFNIIGMYPFLLERKLDDWVNNKIIEKGSSGEDKTGPYGLYARAKIKEIMIEFMQPKLRNELQFENRGNKTHADWWFFYNCLEIVAQKSQ